MFRVGAKVKFANVGTYTIKLEATNKNGKDTEEKINYITVGYPLHVKNNHSIDFSLFPNPTNGLVQINGNFEVTNSLIKVMSINGQLVKQYKHTNQLDVSELPKGAYLIRILSDNKIGLQKLVKN